MLGQQLNIASKSELQIESGQSELAVLIKGIHSELILLKFSVLRWMQRPLGFSLKCCKSPHLVHSLIQQQPCCQQALAVFIWEPSVNCYCLRVLLPGGCVAHSPSPILGLISGLTSSTL